MNKRKIKGVGLGVGISVIATLALGSFAAGNYLVNYAIYVGENKKTNDVVESIEYSSEEMENTDKLQSSIYEEWVKNIEVNEVVISSNDGLKLWGLQHNTQEESHKWAILVHGYTSSHNAMQYRAKEFNLNGYNVITPDNRAHGNSEGNYIGMGWLDKLDIMNWINYIIEQDPDAEIVLLGESMGGATVTMLSGEDLPNNVKAIIEDCGYTSVYDIFAKELKKEFKLPEFPFMDTASVIASIRAGYSFKEASALNQVANASVPMLFIHGDKDDFVPTEMVYKLYEACPTEKELVIFEGAGHAESSISDEKLYFDSIFNFLGKYTY